MERLRVGEGSARATRETRRDGNNKTNTWPTENDNAAATKRQAEEERQKEEIDKRIHNIIHWPAEEERDEGRTDREDGYERRLIGRWRVHAAKEQRERSGKGEDRGLGEGDNRNEWWSLTRSDARSIASQPGLRRQRRRRAYAAVSLYDRSYHRKNHRR